MSRAELEALIERVEQATGPDQEIDLDIAKIAGLFKEEWDEERQTKLALEYDDGVWWTIGADGQHSFDADPYTASLDAIVGLIERELPHYLWQVKRGIPCQAIVWALETDYDDVPAPTGYSATVPALALCAAFLRARLAEATR